PAWKAEPLTLIGEGWDNLNYRLGADKVIRLPKSGSAVALLEKEMRWIPQLPETLPIAVPRPLHVVRASEEFPWPAYITPLFAGNHPVGASFSEAEVLRWVAFLQGLHGTSVASPGPQNPLRSDPLLTKEAQTEERFPLLTQKVAADWDSLIRFWEAAKVLPPPQGKVLIHGDPHPKNILIHEDRFSAVLDWGDMCLGDPATDLASMWMLIAEARFRTQACDAYGMDATTRQRAMGWAFFITTVYLEAGLTADPSYMPYGLQMLKNLKADVD
ncbi:MAG TPA: hypothetical protein DCR93_31930, partial [Cytophagales bacterium]|nr:hypothetical protein [Cytophagales bacterium]